MKKTVIIILTAILTVALTSCSASTDPSPQTEAADTSAETPAGTDSSVAEAEGEPAQEVREPRPEDIYTGAWYTDAQGLPMTLVLQHDGSYMLSVGILPQEDAEVTDAGTGSFVAEEDVQTGSWNYADGFIFLDEDAAAPLDARDDALVWTAMDLFFTREAPQMYEAAALLTDRKAGDFDGYWKSAFVEIGGITLYADAIDDNTDIYIEGENVALGGDIFGDDTAKFTLSNGLLTWTDGTGADRINITIGLQEDGYLRLVMNGADSSEDEAITVILSRVPTAEEIEQAE